MERTLCTVTHSLQAVKEELFLKKKKRKKKETDEEIDEEMPEYLAESMRLQLARTACCPQPKIERAKSLLHLRATRWPGRATHARTIRSHGEGTR